MKSYNNVDMKGRLHNYALERKEGKKGEAISGVVTVEVDEDGTTADMRFYAYPVYNNGKPNKTFGILESMLAGNYKTVVDDGPDADWIEMTGSVDVSYFVGRNASADDDLIRSQKIRGSFINPNKNQKYNNRWKLDFLITAIREIEEDEEKNLPRFVRVIGYLVDDYNKRVMDVVFQARNEKAMSYILGLDASAEVPYFVSTWGELLRVVRTVTRENAFGDAETDEYNSVQWVITGMAPTPYDFGDEAVMTFDQLTEFKAKMEEFKQEQRDKDSGGEGGGKDKDLDF